MPRQSVLNHSNDIAWKVYNLIIPLRISSFLRAEVLSGLFSDTEKEHNNITEFGQVRDGCFMYRCSDVYIATYLKRSIFSDSELLLWLSAVRFILPLYSSEQTMNRERHVFKTLHLYLI
jgi:hypothetical protein